MAQKDLSSPDFRRRAAIIWKSFQANTTLDRFVKCVRQHSKAVFLGYVDLTFSVMIADLNEPIRLKLPGIGVKVLNGKPHLEMPEELGRDNKRYPKFAPVGQDTGAELRTALTTWIFSQPEITQVVENLEAEIQGAQSGSQEGSASAPEPSASEDPAAGTPFAVE